MVLVTGVGGCYSPVCSDLLIAGRSGDLEGHSAGLKNAPGLSLDSSDSVAMGAVPVIAKSSQS